MQPHRFHAAALVVIPLLAGCAPPVESGSDGPPHVELSGSVAGTGGKVFIQWTLGGAAPSEESCAGVDHLTLSLFYAQGRVTIAPIPCTIGRFRYDGLPTGSADLRLDGIDDTG